MISLYYSSTENKYYCQDAENCDVCHQAFDGFGILTFLWSKKESYQYITCLPCAKTIKKGFAKMAETRMFICGKPPIDSIIVSLKPAQLTPSNNLSVFEAADITVNKESGEKVNDKTILSGRDSWQGSQVGNLEYEEKTDTLLSYPEIQLDRYFDRLKLAKPITPKQIEANKYGN